MGKSSARSIRQTDRMKERPDVHACMLYHHCSALMLVVRLATCTQLLHPPAQSVRDIPGKPTVEGVVAVLTCCSHQRGPGSTSRVSACPCWISSCGEDGVCTHEQGLHGGEPGWRYDGGLALGGLLRLHRRRLVRHGCLKEGRASGRQRASGRAQPGNITLCLLVELIWRPHRTHTASTSDCETVGSNFQSEEILGTVVDAALLPRRAGRLTALVLAAMVTVSWGL